MTTPDSTNLPGHNPPPDDHIPSPPENTDEPALLGHEGLDLLFGEFQDPQIQHNQDHDFRYPSLPGQQWPPYNQDAQPSTSRKRPADDVEGDDVEAEASPRPAKKRTSATKGGSKPRSSNKRLYRDGRVIQNQQSNESNESNGNNGNNGNNQEVPGDEGNEEPQKKKRTPQACKNCKAKKMKCDAEPGQCRPCAKQGKECIQTDPVTEVEYTRYEWQSQQEEIRHLKARNRELESRLYILGDAQTIREMMEKQEEKKEPSVKLEPDDNALGFYLDNPNESNLRNIGEYYPSQEPDDPNSILPQPMASYQPVNPNPNQTVGPYPQIPGVPEPGFPAFTNEPGPYFAGNQDQTRTMLQQPHPNYPSVQPGATMRQYVPPRLNRQPQQHPQDVDYSRLVYNDIQEPRIPQQSQRYQQTHPQQPQPQVHHQPTQNRPNKTAGGNSHRQPRPPFDSMENTKHQHPG